MVFLLGLFYGVFSAGSSPATATSMSCSPGIAGNAANVVAITSTIVTAIAYPLYTTIAKATVATITVATIVTTAITATCISKPCIYEPIPGQQPIAPLSQQHTTSKT